MNESADRFVWLAPVTDAETAQMREQVTNHARFALPDMYGKAVFVFKRWVSDRPLFIATDANDTSMAPITYGWALDSLVCYERKGMVRWL